MPPIGNVMFMAAGVAGKTTSSPMPRLVPRLGSKHCAFAKALNAAREMREARERYMKLLGLVDRLPGESAGKGGRPHSSRGRLPDKDSSPGGPGSAAGPPFARRARTRSTER